MGSGVALQLLSPAKSGAVFRRRHPGCLVDGQEFSSIGRMTVSDWLVGFGAVKLFGREQKAFNPPLCDFRNPNSDLIFEL